MSKYIDAESLAAKVRKYLNPYTDESGMVSVENADRWFLSLIENEPTVDVIILPCPIGTLVYQIRKVKVDSNGLGMNYHYEPDVRRAVFDLDLYYQFGKTVFLTEQEAESRLEEMTEEEIKKVLRWS